MKEQSNLEPGSNSVGKYTVLELNFLMKVARKYIEFGQRYERSRVRLY